VSAQASSAGYTMTSMDVVQSIVGHWTPKKRANY